MRKPIVIFVLISAAALLLLGRALAGGGDADPTWGDDGLATAGFGDGFETAVTSFVDSAGRVLVAGYVETPNYPGDFGIVRFLGDGTPDPAFGVDGRVTTDFAENPDNAWSIVERPVGGYLVAGETCDEDYQQCLYGVAAYTDDGALDPAFGSDGLVITDPGTANALAWARRAIMQPDGQLITANIAIDVADEVDVALVRYLPDGQLDPAFGSGGIALVDIGGADYPQSLRLLPDGKFLAAGTIGEFLDLYSYQPEAAFIARFNSDGTLDDTFGSGGLQVWDDDGEPVDGSALAVDGDGRLYALGITGWDSSQLDCVVRRFSADGQPDDTFGDGGRTLIATPADDYCVSLELDPDGRPVAGGYVAATTLRNGAPPRAGRSARAADDTILAARLSPDGVPDPDFGGNGIALFTVEGVDLYGSDGNVQSDGKPLVTGIYEQGGKWDFIAVRFLAADEPPPPDGPRIFLPFVHG
jgi:uncharacterized delta-60 repeat protein